MNSDRTGKRIWIVSPTESVLTTRGTLYVNLASYLSSGGWNVEFISTNWNHAEKRLFSDEECLEAAKRLPYHITFLNCGIYHRNLSIRRILWNLRFAYQLYRLLDRQLHEDDIMLVPSRPPEPVYAAAKLKKKHRCRNLLGIHDIWPDALSTSSGILRRGFATYCNFFFQRAVAQFDAYIHVAPSFLPWLRRYAPGARSTFIPHGFDERRWGFEPLARQIISDGIIKLVYCGTFSNQLDIMPVLKALVSRSERFGLTLIGDNGTGARYSEVMDFIHNNGLQPNITVLGLLPPDQLVKELPSHDITIVPMVSGALPNKIFDSIAAGLPMLSLGAGDSSVLVEQYDMGWVTSFSPMDVGSVLDRITPEEIQIKTQKVLQHRSEYMQWRLLEGYQDVLGTL